MGDESTAHKLDRVRKPRVHITYDVETGGAIEMKELPFVMGIMADLSGNPEQALPNLKDPKRKFVEIDRDNFDEVMKAMAPRLVFKVDSKLTEDESKIGVELKFNGIDDFGPEQIANQVEPLRRLVEIRQQLSALLAKADGNDKLAEKLQDIIKDTELQQKIGKEAGLGEEKETLNG